MHFTILGLYFLIQAVFHASGSELFLHKRYRNSNKGNIYQKKLVFPLIFLGSGLVILGTVYYAVYDGMPDLSF